MALLAHEIRSRLEDVLPGVQRPGRYLALERNLIRKPWDSVTVWTTAKYVVAGSRP